MRRRGFKLVTLLEKETVLRSAVDVPIRRAATEPRVRSNGTPFQRRGTVVLTRQRIAGFAHRTRFVLVRGRDFDPRSLRAEGSWLVIEPRRRNQPGGATLRYAVEDADAWVREARKALSKR